MSWMVGAAVTVAVLAARGPGGRRARAVAGPDRRVVPPGGGPPPAWTARLVPRWSRTRDADRDLALVVTDVAARLRAGAEPATAWREALGRSVPAGGPTLVDLDRSAASRSQAAAVVASGRLAAVLGSPLAPLLDGVAEQLAAQAEAEGERRAALAGPRATARVLTGLPALGVLLGAAVGADPLAVLLDGSIGSACLGVGAGLLLLGRAWTARLARHAAAAGRDR